MCEVSSPSVKSIVKSELGCLADDMIFLEWVEG
jgi:hypothetical protein